MELRDLKSFIEVAAHKSFTKAAAHSYLTQPSLSKAVKKLEEELHVDLFDRSTRNLRLTDAGRIVFEQGHKALGALAELDILLDELMEIGVGEIKIGVPPLVGTLFFARIARSFNRKYPKVTLELVELGAKRICQLVEDGKIDVGMIILPVNDAKFNIYHLMQDQIVLYLHESHKLAMKSSVSLRELREEKFILFSEDFAIHDFVKQTCEQAGFSPDVSYQSSQWDLMIELVSSNLGITLMPQSIYYKQTCRNVKIIPVENPHLYWNLGIITKKEAYQSFALRELLKMVEQHEI